MRPRPRLLHLLAPLPILLLAAGGGDPSSDDTVDARPGADTGTGPDADTSRTLIGSIDVIEQLSTYDDGSGPVEYRSARIGAAFYDGGAPRFHREAMRAGACTLSTYTPSSCTPACTDGLCVETNVCEPWPTLVSAGRLTIAGLAVAVQIDPQSNYYYPDQQLPENLFADAAAITATLAGADLPAASLDTTGVPPLTTAITAGAITVPYPAVDDFLVRWTPADDGSRVRLTLNANNQGHGMPFLAIITCDAADADGQIALPAAMLDAFPETDAWQICAGTDCPHSTITRYRRGATPVGTDRELALIVGSQVDFGIVHHLE